VDEINGWFSCSADAGPDQHVLPGDTVTLDGTGSSAAFFHWIQTDGKGVVLSDRYTAVTAFTAPAGLSSEEELRFRLDVDEGTKTDTVSVWVGAYPRPDAGPDAAAVEGDTVMLDGSGSTDPNTWGGFTYTWIQSGGTAAGLTGADTASPSFTAPDVAPLPHEVLTFELTLTNGYGLTESDAVSIKVYDPDSPRADAGTIPAAGRMNRLFLTAAVRMIRTTRPAVS
jgi:hypothetical protein